ncbi:MAG: lysostaphin resistance A-like protein [Rhodanobacteraceae bacterium]
MTDDANAVGPPPRRPGIWSGIGVVVLYLLLQLAVGLVFGIAIGLWQALKAGFEAGLQHRKPEIRAVVHAAMTNPDTRVVLAVVTIAVAAAIVIAIVHHTWPAQWARAELPGFGVVASRDWRAYLAAVVLGVVVVVLGGLMTHLLAGKHPVHQDVSVLAGEVPLGMRLLLMLLAVGVAPIVEEVVFRGVLLSGLARRMPVAAAIIVSAIIFGCAHLPDFRFVWFPVPALILVGLVLGWLRVRTHSLWPSITMHATNNAMAVLAWFLVAHHP